MWQKLAKNPHFLQVHVLIHAIGLGALTYASTSPSWWSIAGFMGVNLCVSGFGVSVGYHRYFSHRAFTTTRLWHNLMLVMGTLAMQGSVIFWVALHRNHHTNSDTDKDTHSPRAGFWHAYVLWILEFDPKKTSLRRATDLMKDSLAVFTHKHYNRLIWAYCSLLLFVAYAVPSLRPFIAGMFVAHMYAIHQEAMINSICHTTRWGTAPFAERTRDDSRNVNSLQWITWGQALHNNHHAFPSSPNFGYFDQAIVEDLGYKLIIRHIRTDKTNTPLTPDIKNAIKDTYTNTKLDPDINKLIKEIMKTQMNDNTIIDHITYHKQ